MCYHKIRLLLSLQVLLSLLGCNNAPFEKASLDSEVRRLCEIDGGIKVYEKVSLPAERFDNYGNIGVRNVTYASPNDDYYFRTEDVYIRSGNPTLVRSITRIFRRNDEKVLGESIRYGRGGGDLPGPWHGSTFDCPAIRELGLEKAIFKPIQE